MSAFSTYQAAVPVMEAARDRNISQAMATAGFGGNRFGSSAMQRAGEIGASTALQQNQLLANLLQGETQATLDRSLQATGMGLQNEQFINDLMMRAQQGDRNAMMEASRLGLLGGQMQDQMMRDRLAALQGIGQWEQGRQDQFAGTGFQQFMQDRLGTIPLILQALGAGGSLQPTPQQAQQTSTAGSPGAMGYFAALAPIIAAAISDRRLKRDVRKVGDLPLYTWNWKHSGQPGAGFIAQDVEKWAPSAVHDVAGVKIVDMARVTDLVSRGA